MESDCMSEPTAYATFTKKGENIYRDSTYIQWGESSKSIGACLLLNPGSAKLEKDILTILDENKHASGQVTTDQTMKQLITFIERIHGENKAISGRIHIYNLFNLRNAQDVEAIDAFEALVNAKEINIDDSLISEQELRAHPWMLVGWGVAQKKKWTNIQLVKDKWRKLIKETGIPLIGIKHVKHDNYYHPSPPLVKQRQTRLEELVEIYKNTFEG